MTSLLFIIDIITFIVDINDIFNFEHILHLFFVCVSITDKYIIFWVSMKLNRTGFWT